MSPTRQRDVGRRILAVLPYHNSRAVLLEILFRRMPDAALADLRRLLGYEVASQAAFSHLRRVGFRAKLGSMTLIPRTHSEIVAQLRHVLASNPDPFGVEPSRLLDALPFELAKEWLRSEVTAGEWEQQPGRLRTLEDVMKSAVEYLPFAWAKANEARSSSSSIRSVAHFRGLAWLTGNAAFYEKMKSNPQRFDAKVALVAASEFFGVNWREYDNGKWRRTPDDEAPLTAEQALATLTA